MIQVTFNFSSIAAAAALFGKLNGSELGAIVDAPPTEIVKQAPEGIYLSTVLQSGNLVTVIGVAQTNERVSEFLRNTLYNSPWLEKPELVEIKAAAAVGQGRGAARDADPRRLFDFTMRVSIKRPPSAAADSAASAPEPGAKRRPTAPKAT